MKFQCSSGPGWFESHFVGNPEARFLSRHGPCVYVCRVWVFFIVGFMYFSSCLRAPRKIDSSIGLPSLNKVVTLLNYLLTKDVID